LAALVLVLSGDCAHWSTPCPTAGPAPLPPPPAARVPDDAATLAGVAETGATLRACAAAGQYLLSREGKREMTEAELRDVEQALYGALPVHWGSMAMLTGCTCDGERPGEHHDVCIGLHVRAGLIGPVALARTMVAGAQGAGASDAKLRVQVVQVVPPGPRCAASDPACGPLPYDAACAEQLGYRPGRARKPVGRYAAEAPATGEACGHDGECMVAGCGNECVSTREPSGAGTCPYYTALKPALCGCVEGRCTWFTVGR
jgi:hypothetical protein